jgi:hypothetical protein
MRFSGQHWIAMPKQPRFDKRSADTPGEKPPAPSAEVEASTGRRCGLAAA